jgi:hypothetical protein
MGLTLITIPALPVAYPNVKPALMRPHAQTAHRPTISKVLPAICAVVQYSTVRTAQVQQSVFYVTLLISISQTVVYSTVQIFLTAHPAHTITVFLHTFALFAILNSRFTVATKFVDLFVEMVLWCLECKNAMTTTQSRKMDVQISARLKITLTALTIVINHQSAV